jgi:hypothetical protein
MKRFFKTLFLTLLFLSGLSYILLQSPPVQNYVVQKLVMALQDKTGTKVRIGHIDIDFFRGLKMEEVLICDLHDDTVLYAGAMKLDLKDVNFSEYKARISFVHLEKATIKLMRHKADRRWAYLMLLDNFKPKKQSQKTNSADWIIEISAIKFTDCNFRYEDEHARHIMDAFDEDHIWLTRLNGKIDDLRIAGDSAVMEISELGAVEQCGFKIDKLQSHLAVNDHKIHFSALDIVTPNSHVKDNFLLYFESIDDFDDFISKVKIEAHINGSDVSFDDLQFFSSDLRGMHQKIKLSGDAKGSVDNLKCKNVTATFGRQSYFKGNASFKGLPDVYETFFDISTKDALLDKADLEYLVGQSLPAEVTQLGRVTYSMKAIGFMRDFVLEGNFNTSAGVVRTDMNLKFPKEKIESYSGTAYFHDFNLGKLTGNSMLREVNGDVSLNGSGLTLKTITTKIDANLNSIHWNNYTYKNIVAHGTIANKQFSGKAVVLDDNLNLDFDGTIDYSKQESIFDFNAVIKNANLKVLNLDSSNSVLNAQVQMKLRGSNAANIYGGATIPYISYKRGEKQYEFRNLALTSNILSRRRSINVTSDVIDASIDGNYNFNDLARAVENECHYLYPDYFREYPKVSVQDFVFTITLKKPEEFISLLDPKLNLKPTTIDGYLNTNNHSYAVNLISQQVAYNQYALDTVMLRSQKKPDEPFNVSLSTRRITTSEFGAPLITRDSIHVSCKLNHMDAYVLAIDGGRSNRVRLESTLDFMKDGVSLLLTDGGGVYSNVLLDLSNKEPVYLNRDGARFTDFKIRSEGQEVVLNGMLTAKDTDRLNIAIHDFRLETINALVKNMDVNLYGTMNGNLSVNDVFNSPYFSTDSNGITIKTFRVDNDTFGNLRVNSSYRKSENVIDAGVRFTDGDLQNVSLAGKIHPNRKGDYLDFDLVMGETHIKVLNFIVKGSASDLEGTLTGKAKLTGTFDKPDLNGKAFIQGGGFTVDYVKTHYRLDNEVLITKNSFELKNIKIYDENRRTAIANCKVSHQYFSKWFLDIGIRNFSNFKLMNTTPRDNDLFYGTGYGSGYITIIGDIDRLKMVLNLKSNKGTLVNLPLTNPEFSSKSSYITFKDKTQKNAKQYQVNTDGIEFDIHLDINEDAYIKLIFDSQLGDIIEGTGNGNISMNVAPNGDFTIYGYYEIDQGKYVFTKYDIINKPFIINSGGRITWDGDPYAAKMNLQAVYYIAQANASSLVATPSTTTGTAPPNYIPVNCILYLKGLLFKPDITFNLEIPRMQNFQNPTLENTIRSYISSWQQNPDEMTRQVFSLLFFKRFLTLDNSNPLAGSNSGGVGYTALGDLLTAQLTNWLGQVFTNNPFGLDYNRSDPERPGVWTFKVNKTIYDRFVVEGNFLYSGEQSSNSTGNLSAQVLIDKTGQMRITVFSKLANNTFTYNQNVWTNGVGFYWRKEFNSFRRPKKAPKITDPPSSPE